MPRTGAGGFLCRTPSKLAAEYQAPPSLWGGSRLPRLGLVGEEPGRWGRCTCSTNFGALPGVWGGGATPPHPFPSNLAKLPRQPRGRPLGQRSGARGRGGCLESWHRVMGLEAMSARTRAHTLHTYTQPRETQRAAPRRRPFSPWAGGDPHPAPARPDKMLLCLLTRWNERI